MNTSSNTSSASENPEPVEGLNTCDAPFGESFQDYLASQEQHARHLASKRPVAELETNDRPTTIGDYSAKVTSRNTGHDVHLITKQHCGLWHTPEQILESLRISNPFGYREFCPIGKTQATLKVHTD